jgi:hypothetical protein
MTKPETAPCCCICWIDGPKPIDNWSGAPICREHMAETRVRTSGHPVITPSPGLATAATTLQ